MDEVVQNEVVATESRWHNLIRDIFLCEPGIDPAMAENLASLTLRVVRLWLEKNQPQHDRDCGEAERSQDIEAGSFDPYAFGAVATLLKDGRDELLRKLECINDPQLLRQLASYQHLTVASSIDSIERIREAIIDSAERRLERRFQASR